MATMIEKEDRPYHPIDDPQLSGIGKIYDMWVPPGAERDAMDAVRKAFTEPLSSSKAAWFVDQALSAATQGLVSFDRKYGDSELEGLPDSAQYIADMIELAVLPAIACEKREFQIAELHKIEETFEQLDAAVETLKDVAGGIELHRRTSSAVASARLAIGNLRSAIGPYEDVLIDAHF